MMSVLMRRRRHSGLIPGRKFKLNIFRVKKTFTVKTRITSIPYQQEANKLKSKYKKLWWNKIENINIKFWYLRLRQSLYGNDQIFKAEVHQRIKNKKTQNSSRYPNAIFKKCFSNDQLFCHMRPKQRKAKNAFFSRMRPITPESL